MIRLITILFALSSSVSVFGQEIKNLVFEGSGMRGLAYAGVIEELEKKGIITNIERVGGTSAGAVTALLISLGYTAEQIRIILSETKFQKFNDGGPGAFTRLKRKFGWFKGEAF